MPGRQRGTEQPGSSPSARVAGGALPAIVLLGSLAVLSGAVLVGLDASSARQIDPVLAIGAALFAVAAVIISRTAMSRVRAASAVADAVRAAAEHNAGMAELRVDPAHGPIAIAWNALASEGFVGSAAGLDAGTRSGAIEPELLNAMTHGIVGIDRNGTICLANTAVQVLAGKDERLTERELMDLIGEEAEDAIKAVLLGKLTRRKEIERAIEGEQPQTLRTVVVPVASETIQALVLLEDVTRQRAAEASRGEFVAQATHELRAPLTNIRLYIDEAIDAGENDAEMREQALSVISNETQRLERIVSDLLSLSELESGARQGHRGDVRVEQMLDDIRRAFERSAEEKGITLSFETTPNLPVLKGDRDHVAMLLQNLVSNAIKYTPQGGSVTVRAGVEDGVFVADVIDTGIGIAQDEAKQVFEKFFRSGDDRIREIDGSGLGLAFAREVARQHGGDVTLDTELNRGSTFTLKLPASRAA